MSLTWGIGADVRPTGHQLLCLWQHGSELRQPLSFQPDERAEGAIQLRGQRAAGQEDLQGAVRLHLQASVLGGDSTPTASPLHVALPSCSMGTGSGGPPAALLFHCRQNLVSVKQTYQYPDTQPGDEDAFSREPFVVWFQSPKTGGMLSEMCPSADGGAGVGKGQCPSPLLQHLPLGSPSSVRHWWHLGLEQVCSSMARPHIPSSASVLMLQMLQLPSKRPLMCSQSRSCFFFQKNLLASKPVSL